MNRKRNTDTQDYLKPIVLMKVIGIVAPLAALLFATSLSAQQNVTVKEMIERDQAEIEAVTAAAPVGNREGGAIDRSTPRRVVLGTSAALAASDFEGASKYLDMRYLPDNISPEDGPKLVRQLAYVFNRHLWIDMASINDKPEGYQNDGLPPYRDLLGEIETGNGPITLFLQRVPDGKGGKEWRISNATVAQIPFLWKEFGHSDFAEQLAHALPEFTIADIDNWQLAYLGTFLFALLFIVAVLHALLGKLDPTASNYTINSLRRLLTGPLGFFLYIVLLRWFMHNLGMSVKARAVFDSVLLIHLSYIFLALGVIDLIAAQVRRRMIKNDKAEAVVIIPPMSAVVKMVCVAVLIVMGLDSAGFNVTAIIAGLGVGSIAVALAAQNTLENLIGAITIYIARPFKPGDLCRIGEELGVVEEIGLRSTHLRKLDRTIVNIPNGMLSSTKITNVSRRDNIRFLRLINIRITTSPDQMRYLLANLRKILYSHPKVIRNTVSVRLSDISDFAFVLRLDSRFDTTNYQDYLAIAEDLYLRIIDAVQDCGIELALPSQRISMDEPLPPDNDRRKEIELLVDQWREQNSLPYPDWPQEYIDKINGTLDYPPSGTPKNPEKITPPLTS